MAVRRHCRVGVLLQSGGSSESDTESEEARDVWKKLKQLERNLHQNHVSHKRSACFWCTCDFDNPAIFIPKCYVRDAYEVYGCFCSPECAAAFLMREHIDSSAKFERYHMLNHLYSKVYNYTKNIKPAPDPFHMLDKFCGNLTIQEYRSLLRNERLFLIVDKPLTRVLPELHEDNDDFIISHKMIPVSASGAFVSSSAAAPTSSFASPSYASHSFASSSSSFPSSAAAAAMSSKPSSMASSIASPMFAAMSAPPSCSMQTANSAMVAIGAPTAAAGPAAFGPTSSSAYLMRRAPKQSKATIMNEKFGFSGATASCELQGVHCRSSYTQ